MARLRRSNLAGEGYHRAARGRIVDEHGKAAPIEVRERASDLVIPPAWSEVWIAPHDNDHIQAVGTDAAGRRQYLYHPQWRRQKDKTKFDRSLELAAVVPAARRAVTRDLRGDDARRAVLAVAFRLLDVGALRVGSARYAEENGSHGLSTLLCGHVRVSGEVVALDFPAKSGKTWSSSVADPELAVRVARLARRAPTAPLLAYQDAGEWHSLSALDINAYVRERTGGAFTAKDFRTLRGTAAAALSLARHGPERTRAAQQRAIAQAMRDAADALGNTPAIARTSYVDPRVVAAYRTGTTVDAKKSPEVELRRLLG